MENYNESRNEAWREELRKSKTAKERNNIARVEMPQLDPAYRITCNEEVNQGINAEQAVLEATRCLDSRTSSVASLLKLPQPSRRQVRCQQCVVACVLRRSSARASASA